MMAGFIKCRKISTWMIILRINEERLLKYDISKDFILVAELFDITGRAIKIELFKKEE